MSPKLVFGTATFGAPMSEFQDKEVVQDLLTTLEALDIKEVDTAARYPPTNPGRSEELIGLAKEASSAFAVDSKVLADTSTDGSGELSRNAIQKSITATCERLQRPKGVSGHVRKTGALKVKNIDTPRQINILYAHRPDPSTPLKEQIQVMDEHIRAGHCQAWGVSNTPPVLLEEILKLCEENGWQKPACYQGTYNMFTRGMETQLLPILRSNNMSHYTFQVLGAGFLTGKLVNDEHTGTRLDGSNPLSKVILDKFGFVEMKATMKCFDAEIKANGLSSIEVALRWAAHHHSMLGDQDAIILGASKKSQLINAVDIIRRGPLPESVLRFVEQTEATLKDSRAHII